jgi:hypothetical protein
MNILRPSGNAGTGNISNETTELGIFSTNGTRPSGSGYEIVLTNGNFAVTDFLTATAFVGFAFGGTDFAFDVV